MNHPAKSFCIALCLVLLPSSASAVDPCVQSGPFTTPTATAAGLSFAAGVPSHVRSGAVKAAGEWGASTCNESQNFSGAQGFPFIVEGYSSGPQILVNWVDGFGKISATNGASVCGLFNSTGGGNAEITLYSKFILPGGDDNNGSGYPCPATTEQGARRLAGHEMGHFLGLGNTSSSTCSGASAYMMGPVQYNLVNGQFSGWNSTSLAVTPQPGECQMADALTETPDEEQASIGQCEEGLQDCSKSPVIIDLDRDGLALTSWWEGVEFDFDGDGQREATSWTSGEGRDGFLWLDRNGNDQADNGAELFGNFTPLLDGGRASHGFDALQEFDNRASGGNGDGLISDRDAIYSHLRVWIDQDRDGRVDTGEAQGLRDAGVTTISLRYLTNGRKDRFGNQYHYKSKVQILSEGQVLPSWATDVFFVSPWR